ncbi:MAG: complex I subunit 1 family protein [Planctomycetota bacterium]|jgi:NADH-quinone oxidoreductase subunit H
MSVPLNILFWVVVIPGTVILGLVVSWIVRKVSALVQWRVGPPLCQPLYDIMKLMGKEILVPQDAQRTVFMAAPLVGLAGVLLLSMMLWRITVAQTAFIGDIIVAIYLMVLPSLALILGSSASASPHAAVGTSREMKLVMGYELSLVLAFIVVIIKTGGQLELATIAQQAPALSISGMLAFLAALLCVQAKLGFVPFDMAEAETELGSGILMEYSGGWSLVWGIGKYVLIVVLLILIKNTNPRVRIDQAMKFFWVYCGIALVAAIILATIGSYYGIGWL